MASRRYTDAFDEDAVNFSDEECTFLSDSGDEFISDDEDVVCVVEKDKEIVKAERMQKLNSDFKESISKNPEAYDNLVSKLKWATEAVQPEASSIDDDLDFKTPMKKSKYIKAIDRPYEPIQIEPEQRQQERINKPCKYIMENKTCPFGSKCCFSHVSTQSEKNNRICKFILEDKPCPFGSGCRFSHERKFVNPEMKTINGKSKKIWMCRPFITMNHCKYGENCPYAHSDAEVKANVSRCGFANNCSNVKNVNGIFSNVEGARKCMRLHERETIRNFIQRTS
jgi:hypothetical protein